MRLRRMVVALVAAFGAASVVQATTPGAPLMLAEMGDLTNLSLEQLLNVEITTASHFAQKTSEAPSSVSVLSAEDFRDYGWRTLADALNSVRGFFVNSDHTYRYAGVRGFTPPGDYNFRLLVLIDGMRTNDNVYDQAFLGNDFHLDVDLIDRIEIVRGPSSTIYGANAVFGVINVITKRGRDFERGEVAASVSSFGSREGRVTAGGRFADEGEYLLSVTSLRYGGQNLSFPEFSGTTSPDRDREHSRKYYGKVSYGNFSLAAGLSDRQKNDPTGFYGKVFNDPANQYLDRHAFLDGRYSNQISGELALNGRVFYNSYDYRYAGRYNDAAGRYIQIDQAAGRWWGTEMRLLYSGWRDHKLGLGMDYQHNAHQDQKNYTYDMPGRGCATTAAAAPCFDDRRAGFRFGVTLTDDWALTQKLHLNAGLRFDHDNANKDHVSPRVGLVYQLQPETTLKLIYGSAYRAPNAYERYYAYPGTPNQVGNSRLRPEVVDTYELIWEQYLAPATRFVVNTYQYKIRNWSVQQDVAGNLMFTNQQDVNGKGLDLELEHRFGSGANLRSSVVTLWTPDRPQGFLNAAPEHMAKLNFSSPLPWVSGLRLGWETQYVSSRPKENGDAKPYLLSNATLRWLPRGEKGMEVSASVYNLFNRNWARVFTDDSLASGVTRELMEQDRRVGRVKVVWPF